VDFRAGAQQQLLAQTARAVLTRLCPPERAQALALDPRATAPDLWKEMATLGWTGLLVPPEHGGSGGSMLDVAALAEELGRACAPGPYVASAVIATALLAHPTATASAARMLPGLATGDRIATLALAEEAGTVDLDAVGLRAAAPGRLTGTKLFVADAHAATDLVVVFASAAGGLDVARIEVDRRGVAREPLDAITGDKLCAVRLDGVEIAPADLVAPAGGARAAVAAALAAGAVARTAEMVGAAQRVLELCVEHARVRVQSGRPIGAFQAVQHHCADIWRDVESSRWVLWEAAWRLAEGQPAETEIALAKAYAGEACLRAARRGHQVMGAMGYCEEHPLHLLHKRILGAGLDAGDTAHHLEHVARVIGLA
jgi:alkylation response protein AidB-like acyl-CoA dehydrogenase